jgi:hypothetical protein
MLIEQNPAVDVDKGKQVVDTGRGFRNNKHQVDERPQVKQKLGVTKLNVDEAFSQDGTAGAGMILRDHTRAVIFTACRQLRSCADTPEAELAAMEEGLALALHWTPRAIVLESDSLEAINLVSTGTPNLSRYAMRINRIRESIREEREE